MGTSLDGGPIGTRLGSVAYTVKGLGVNVLVHSSVKLLCVYVDMGDTQCLKLLGLWGARGFTGLML